jgi:hypothetical protein
MSHTIKVIAGGLALPGVFLLVTAARPLAAQTADSVRRLSPAQTGCDPSKPVSADSVYAYDAVDQEVKAEHLEIDEMPLRVREVLDGRSVFRFIVDRSGRIERCSIELVEEDTPTWTDAVLKELRNARYQPARLGGNTVKQRVYQIFTYHQDGRLLHGR